LNTEKEPIMAFTDPQSVTVSGTPVSLPRILTGTAVGNFKSSDGNTELTLDPRGTSKRRRNVARLYTKANVTDPITGLVSVQGYMISITVDRPLTGITDAQVEASFAALSTWATATTNANFKKLAAGEN
jgi:hypothetical protein